MTVAAHVRISGSLSRYADGFAAELLASGYTDLSLANQLRLMADFSRWLEVTAKTTIDRIDHKVVARFLSKRRRTHTHFVSQRAIEPLLRYLDSVGVVTFAAAPARPRSELLRAYERYLIEERDAGPRWRAFCLEVAEEFLGKRRTTSLTAADVTRFVAAKTDRPVVSEWLSGLRSVLQFLFVSSRCSTNLVWVVPSSPRWTQRSLPQGLEPDVLATVLATCDRRTLVGCRDYAVLLLLSRLGLRAGEVAALQLEAIDWRTGEIAIHGKGSSLSRLPLPVDTGHAIAAYLKRARRSTTTRSVFVRCRAPYTSLTSGGIIGIAHRALRAAGVERGGAHRLRHTAATQMLRRGASLTEIAQVLRHRHVNTTAIYAKVDSDALRGLAKAWPIDAPDPARVRALAQPWPGGVA